MGKYKYLLFDADNTIFDFSKAEYNSFKATCAEFGVEFSEELYHSYSVINDALWKKLEKNEIKLEVLKTERFRQLLTEKLGHEDNDATLDLAGNWRKKYMDTLSSQSCLIDGAYEVCSKLSEKYKLYIVTNGVSHIQRKRFCTADIMKYFCGLFISEEIGYAKPSEKYFDHVIGEIGEQDKSEYLVIGDSLTSDVDGAINYGLDICFFNPRKISTNGRTVTYNIGKLSELAEILL